jgi:cation:H+ antiporter
VTWVLVFLISGAVVVVAGSALTRFADVIAEATGLGRLWIGTVLVAGATSLPELTTDLSAVRLGAADLAVGDLFGSSLANMLILAVIDLAVTRRQVLRRAASDHAVGASWAIALNALAAALVLARPGPATMWVGPGTLLLFVAYLAGARAVHRHSSRDAAVLAPAATGVRRAEVRRAALGFAAAALAVVVAAPAFAWSAKGIAELTGLGNTLVGTWLVGLSTSLPELVACFAALRLGSVDLAVGTLFGSNALNMAIFLPLDLAQPGSLFAVIDRAHALTAVFAVVLMSLGLAAIAYRPRRRGGLLDPHSLLVLVSYCAAIWLLFRQEVSG